MIILNGKHSTAKVFTDTVDKMTVDYDDALIKAMEIEMDGASEDDIYNRAVTLVNRERKVSTSLLQRKLGIGYGRAARAIDRMEEEGLIGPKLGALKPREIFAETVAAKAEALTSDAAEKKLGQ